MFLFLLLLFMFAGLVFKHTASAWKQKSCFLTLPKGNFLVRPNKKLSVSVKWKHKKTEFKCSMCQFEVLPALATTGHKCQALTLDNLIVGPLSFQYMYGGCGWIYVCLSRVRSLDTLYLMEPLPKNISKYKPRTRVMREMKRMGELSVTTVTSVRRHMRWLLNGGE